VTRDDDSATPTAAEDVPARTPGEVPEWTPAWTMPFEGWDVPGLDAVAGRVAGWQWSAVHAFDRASGKRRWSIERERELGIAGLADDLVVATGDRLVGLGLDGSRRFTYGQVAGASSA